MLIDEKKYNIEKVELFHGAIRYNITPKEKECQCCKKVFPYKSLILFDWCDKQNYRRSALLCKTCKDTCLSQLQIIGRRK